MNRHFNQNDIVYNPKTNETKTVFIALEETFVAMDGSVNLISDFTIDTDKTEGDSDGIID